MNTIVCGKGRLGLLITSKLPVDVGYARVDAQRGLVQDGEPLAGQIDTLILCFVPKHEEGKSGWQGLLQGLQQQVQRGELSIGRTLFISSTAAGGSDPVRSQGLLDAERTIPHLAPATAIFRLTGLVGPGYLKYDPVTYSMDKPRQAVDTRAVATEVGKWFARKQQGHTCDVLTDGYVYWQGRKLEWQHDREAIEPLAAAHHLPRPSLVCR